MLSGQLHQFRFDPSLSNASKTCRTEMALLPSRRALPENAVIFMGAPPFGDVVSRSRQVYTLPRPASRFF
jgi:hypothetical protein